MKIPVLHYLNRLRKVSGTLKKLPYFCSFGLLSVSAFAYAPQDPAPRFYSMERTALAEDQYAFVYAARLSRAETILNQIDPSFTLEFLPFKRLYPLILNSAEPICAVGLYKTESRLKDGKFSEAFVTEQPGVIAVRTENYQEISGLALFQALLKSDFIISRHPDASYGDVIDKMISDNAPPYFPAMGRKQALVSLAVSKAADYTIIEEQDLTSFKEANPRLKDLAAVRFDNLPPLPARYFMCSRSTPDAVLTSLNTAIAQIK